MTFGERLRELRVARHLTQGELARLLFVSPSIISMYELDKRKPSFEQEEIMADFFNVDLSFLRGSTDSTTEIVSAETHILIQMYKRLNPMQQQLVLGYTRGVMDFQNAIDREIENNQRPEPDEPTL